MENNNAPDIYGLTLVKANHNIALDAFSHKENSNRARSQQGSDELHVMRLKTSFEGHGWDYNEPLPIAVQNSAGDPVLIDGHHRRDAWALLGHHTLPVNYYKLDGKVRLDDIILRQGLKANDHKPSKPVSVNDVERMIQEEIEEEGSYPSYDEVLTKILSLGLKSFAPKQLEGAAQRITARVNSSEQVTPLNGAQIQKMARENSRLDKPQVWLPTSFAGASRASSELRNLRDVCQAFKGDPVDVGFYVTDAKSTHELSVARDAIIKGMEKQFDRMRAVIEQTPKGKYPWKTQGAAPQSEREVERGHMVNFTH